MGKLDMDHMREFRVGYSTVDYTVQFKGKHVSKIVNE